MGVGVCNSMTLWSANYVVIYLLLPFRGTTATLRSGQGGSCRGIKRLNTACGLCVKCVCVGVLGYE